MCFDNALIIAAMKVGGNDVRSQIAILNDVHSCANRAKELMSCDEQNRQLCCSDIVCLGIDFTVGYFAQIPQQGFVRPRIDLFPHSVKYPFDDLPRILGLIQFRANRRNVQTLLRHKSAGQWFTR